MTIRPQVLFSMLLGGMLLLPASLFAQQAGGINVALVDISQVFKNHERFKMRTEEIRKEIKDYEAQMNEKRKVLTEKRNGLTNFKVGSPEYERLEAEIAREITNLEVEVNSKRRDILEREAKVYYETYLEVQNAVTAFCSRHNISLVLRFDGESIDPNDRASVLRGVNRAVVYQDRINITTEILKMVNVPQAASVSRP
jgi:Skp family chaperone for outer membrane proteins